MRPSHLAAAVLTLANCLLQVFITIMIAIMMKIIAIVMKINAVEIEMIAIMIKIIVIISLPILMYISSPCTLSKRE